MLSSAIVSCMDLPKSSIKRLLFFTILVFSSTSEAKNPEFFTYFAENFNETHYSMLTKSGNASINQRALQLTPDSINDDFSLINQSGRVMFTKPFKLWEEVPSPSNNEVVVASFNSTFDISVLPVNRSSKVNRIPGEGLAFVIAPDLETPSNSFGQWLGLTNASLDGLASNKFVAIELDTVKQDYDSDNNHMGLNINSVRLNKTVHLADIEIAPIASKTWTVWVVYNGSSKVMDVYMGKKNDPRPNKPILSEDINLEEHVLQNSYMGFSASTGQTVELNCILRWDLKVEILPEKKNRTWLKILLGVGVPGLIVLVGIAVGVTCYLRKMTVFDDRKISGALKKLPGAPREFRFQDLKVATKNFDERMKLGQGGFGVVYRGVLGKENVEVAVKKFSRESMKSKEDFLAELAIINRLRHKHLVRLIGWCHKNGMLLLVYEYMPNGSVDNHLFGSTDNFLNWSRRYNIISGLASALNYLHNEYDQKVIHRDLKSGNILLDSDYNARLGDFGLARAIEHGRTSYAELEGVPGTIGYIAPEMFHSGKATGESDVYGFGAVVLEVVCGQRPWTKVNGSLALVDWVWKLYREGHILDAVDKRLGEEYVHEEAQRLLLLALSCSHPVASERPTMQSIVQIVSRCGQAPIVPHFKPAFVWIGSIDDIITTNTTPSTSSYYTGGSENPKYLSRESYAGPR